MYRKVPVSSYMNKKDILKFWQIKDMTELEKIKWQASANFDMMQPWYKRFYDFFGVAGHLVGLSILNVPFRNYCSERVARRLRAIEIDMPKHPTPADLNKLFKDHPRFVVFGYWSSEGVG